MYGNVPDLTNIELAAALDELGDLNELDGAIVHRVVAYRNAAKAVREAPASVAALVREGRATELPGVGKTLDEKLRALLETGTIPAAEKLRAKFPAGLVAMTKLEGLGPKRARRLYDELGIDSLEALREAASAGRISELKGFGAKAEQSLLASLEAHEQRPASTRLVLPKALPSPRRSSTGCARTRRSSAPRSPARRGAWPTTSRTSTSSSRRTTSTAVVAAFAALEVIAQCERGGDGGARGLAQTGLRIDLRVVTAGDVRQPAPALHRQPRRTTCACARWPCAAGSTSPSTGSSTTPAARRCAARPRRRSTRRSGCTYVEPELRENRGELEPGFEPPRARHARRPARRPALPHGRQRRARDDRGDGADGA